jgi:hypothetical protein
LRTFISQAYTVLDADGFAQRFDFVFPDPVRITVKPPPSDYDEYKNGSETAIRYYKKLADANLTSGLPLATASNGDVFSVVKISPEGSVIAEACICKFETESKQIETEDEVFAACLFKLPKRFYSVALIFHCLENIDRDRLPAEIAADTIEMAAACMDYLVSRARRVYALGENEIFALANSLIGNIKEGRLEHGFTVHQIARKQWSGLSKRNVVEEVVQLLEEYGYLISSSYQPSRAGRSTVKYYFHPSLEKANLSRTTGGQAAETLQS